MALKEMKSGRYYLLVNIDEPYAEDVFEIIKCGQMAKENPETAWPEGDIDFRDLVAQTWPDDEGANAAWYTGQRWRDEHHSPLLYLRAQLEECQRKLQTARDALEELEAAIAIAQWDLREGLDRETAYTKDLWMRNALGHLRETRAALKELGE